MYKVQNITNKKFVKDAISGKAREFSTIADAQKCADSSAYYSVANATAWNNVRPSKFAIVEVR